MGSMCMIEKGFVTFGSLKPFKAASIPINAFRIAEYNNMKFLKICLLNYAIIKSAKCLDHEEQGLIMRVDKYAGAEAVIQMLQCAAGCISRRYCLQKKHQTNNSRQLSFTFGKE